MTWLRELAEGAMTVAQAVWATLVDAVTSPTGPIFIAAWALVAVGSYIIGRVDRQHAREKRARRAQHGRRAAR